MESKDLGQVMHVAFQDLLQQRNVALKVAEKLYRFVKGLASEDCKHPSVLENISCLEDPNIIVPCYVCRARRELASNVDLEVSIPDHLVQPLLDFLESGGRLL